MTKDKNCLTKGYWLANEASTAVDFVGTLVLFSCTVCTVCRGLVFFSFSYIQLLAFDALQIRHMLSITAVV